MLHFPRYVLSPSAHELTFQLMRQDNGIQQHHNILKRTPVSSFK